MALIHQQERALKLTCPPLSGVGCMGSSGMSCGERRPGFFSSFLGERLYGGVGGKTTDLLRLPYLCLTLNAVYSSNYTGFV